LSEGRFADNGGGVGRVKTGREDWSKGRGG